MPTSLNHVGRAPNAFAEGRGGILVRAPRLEPARDDARNKDDGVLFGQVGGDGVPADLKVGFGEPGFAFLAAAERVGEVLEDGRELWEGLERHGVEVEVGHLEGLKVF